ncbi:MAG: DUF4412 domain-containing protein [Gemmatimonadaceae bacterium]|nr:DUF4412 domain-containing protein [Gemmatimonadaceae bacterium]
MLNGIRWRRLAAFVGCVTPLTIGAQSFEGAIMIRVVAGGRNGPATADSVEYLSRGGNVRINMMSPAGAVSILALATEGKTYAVLATQRAYMEMSAGDAAGSVAESAGATTISRSGRKETIAGYECEHVLVESNGATGPQKTDMCLTKALGPYVNPVSGLAGARLTPWQRQLASEGGFPLKVTLSDGSVALEVTRIQKRRVSDTLFRIPADFSKMEMPKRP